MKKIILILSLFFFLPMTSSAEEMPNNSTINLFIDSPNVQELTKIKDPVIGFCEETFLEAYRRRAFSDVENLICSEIFEQKIEAELEYIRYVFGERGIN